jgi:dolichyl-phosphate-mannose-protein mannosyltransferase
MFRVSSALATDTTVYAACVVSFALAVVFIFAWAPHPWGWEGFDHYHDLALALVSGRGFPTMEVPWGYAYFAAFWYRLFGDRPWIVLVVQALLNAALPWLVYRVALTWTDRRTAIAAAAITGVCSFNTVYASTQSSDAVCTVLFMTAVLIFAGTRRDPRWWRYAAAGALAGIASQFRPNLVLLPLLFAGYAVATTRTAAGATRAAVVVACAGAALLPWTVRNYRLTGMILPTSVHGSVQLWYGSLEAGPYLHSQAYNPRAVFAAPAFEYTSLDEVPIVVQAHFNCTERALTRVALAYRVNGDSERRLAPERVDARTYTFEIATPRPPAVVRYYVAATWADPSGMPIETATPPLGADAPSIYFVSEDHLGDQDIEGDLLDVFDLVRLMRRTAWGDRVPFDDRLRTAGVDDERSAAAVLLRPFVRDAARAHVSSVQSDAAQARLTFADGSSMTVPRTWSGGITDIAITEGMASTVMTSRQSLAALSVPREERPVRLDPCLQSVEMAVNQVFYRREPQMMRRYTALALDNIRRDPMAFLRAAAYRSVRMFVIQGASDWRTAAQFARSRAIYAAATAASAVFLAVCAAGVAIAWRRGEAIGLPLLLIAAIPISLAPVLINMRYTVTVQPLMFVFAATALTRSAAESPPNRRRPRS